MPGRDISVFGYDDTEWCSQIYPTLSSVRADVSKLGSKACELLCRMMQGEKVSSVRLPTDLVIRIRFAGEIRKKWMRAMMCWKSTSP